MNAIEVLSLAKTEGVVLALNGDRLTWRANQLPPDELLAEIKSHRLEIIEALATAGQVWLAAVARLLECSPAYLLADDFIDQYDLAEQCSSSPKLAAELIRGHPTWTRAQAPPQFHPPADRPDDLAQHIHHSAATASTEWLQARDLYMGHLMTCRNCYAPTDHYCSAGAELRARYNATP